MNVITGDGAAVGGELSRNPFVRNITFTGATRVGKLLYKQSAETMKKLSMELGGNAPTIIFDDADLRDCWPVITLFSLLCSSQEVANGDFSIAVWFVADRG